MFNSVEQYNVISGVDWRTTRFWFFVSYWFRFNTIINTFGVTEIFKLIVASCLPLHLEHITLLLSTMDLSVGYARNKFVKLVCFSIAGDTIGMIIWESSWSLYFIVPHDLDLVLFRCEPANKYGITENIHNRVILRRELKELSHPIFFFNLWITFRKFGISLMFAIWIATTQSAEAKMS